MRRVEKGATFEVTDRGRAVALLTPLPGVSPIDRLRLEGDLTPATGALSDLPPPLPLAAEQTAPSVILARLRADER